MSEPLTDAEVAELRRLQRAVDEDTHHIDNGAENARDDAAGAALPRLLDELERLRGIVGSVDWRAEESAPKDSYVWVRQRRPR